MAKSISISSNFNNPFEGRNADEVWQELIKNSSPISKDEFIKRLKQIKSNKKK